MNFLNKITSAAVSCLFLLGCYAGPVHSPRTSSVKLRNENQPSHSNHNYYNEDVALTTDQPSNDHPRTGEEFGIEEPETVNDTVFYFYLPGVSEQPTLLSAADIPHVGQLHSEFMETLKQSDIHKGADPQELEEPADNLGPHLSYIPIKTFEFLYSTTVAASTDPAELSPMYPLVRVPAAPSVTPITIGESPRETLTKEKLEIDSSPDENSKHSLISSGLEQVRALPLDRKLNQQIDSHIPVDCPSNNSSHCNGSIGSNPKLFQLAFRFPSISNTQDNFNVKVNWTEFM